MLFNEVTKQAFVFPPKTGSHTVKEFLKKKNWNECASLNWHDFTDCLIEKLPKDDNYTIYGFFRNPLTRFESGILFIKQHVMSNYYFSELLRSNRINIQVKNISYDEVVDLFDLINTDPFFNILFLPQIRWLDHSKVTMLDFDKFEYELRRVSNDLTTPIPFKNVSSSVGKSVVTNKVKDFVAQKYAEDYSYAKKVTGKEYLQ